MKKLFLLCFVLLDCIQLSQAQTSSTVKAQAMAAYNAKSYKASGRLFDQTLKDQGAKPTGTDYYNAACTWALAGNATKAFGYLDQATAGGWDDVAHLKQDADLAGLHPDKRWLATVQKLEAAVAKADAKLNQPLKKELAAIYVTDQGTRSKMDSVQKNFTMQSPQWEALMADMKTTDERNTKRVVEMIEQHGWPGNNLVGRRGSTAAFLVIQHADAEIQRKYLPLMRKAAAKGELAKSELALLEDRVLVRQGKLQIYGSQLRNNPDTDRMEFFPIEDEAHVDERRSTMGLGTLTEYAKHFGLEYVPKKN